ncbi:MAG: hypothetical protein Q4A56_01555 [Porphyromonadaceae bacterium]|nr:hypothetical protein [Porphyromonadaceae bacterium]
MSKNKLNVKQLIYKTFNLHTLTFGASLIVMATILTTLHQGISCDEGFYLMGYLHNQPSGNFISDYANIVQSFTPERLEANIMVYRYERLIGFVVSLLIFALSLYRWLVMRYNIKINILLYGSLLFMSGTMSYTFATPTISYDSIQTFVYLLAFSFMFWAVTSYQLLWTKLFLLLSGMVSIVGLLNYFPSGVFLIVFLSVWIILDMDKNRLQNLAFYLFGLVIGAVLYHFLVRNLIEYAGIAFDTIVKVFTEESASRHDSNGLIKSFIIKFGVFSIFIPFILLLSVIFKKIKLPKYVIYILVFIIILFLLLYRDIYYYTYAPLFFIPIAIQIAWLIANETSIHYKKDLLLLGILIILPFLAVFGTNQNLFTKMLIFIPFWLITYFILYSKTTNSQIKNITATLLVILFFAGYFYLGNFSRYHYYYTPRSSKYRIENIERPQNITFSLYQKEYFEELSNILYDFGAQKGDKYLAFGENQMSVFLMGGYICGKLPYHWFQYKDFPKERPKFLILFKNEEQEVIDLLSSTSWCFPDDYNRIEFRPMSQNMDQEELRTVIYALN